MTLPGMENAEDAFGLSPAQAGMVYETITAPDAGYYAGLFDAILPRDIDIDLFKSVWSEVIARHQALRSLIIWRNVASPIQVVRKSLPPDYWREETVDADKVRTRLEALRREQIVLEKTPALGLHLLHRSDGRIHFAWICHHAVVDDWSVANVLWEIATLYSARSSGASATLPFTASLRDFAQWRMSRNDATASSFWRELLRDFDEPLRLPTRSQHGATPEAQDGVHDTALSPNESSKLKETARRLRVTMASVITTALSVVLHRAADMDDVVFGMATAQRPSDIQGIEQSVGNFVTTCPIRVKLDGATSLSDLTKSINDTLVETHQHAHLPLRSVTELSAVADQSALFDTVLSLKQAGNSEGDLFGDSGLFEEQENYATAHYGLSILVTPAASIKIRILFNQARYDIRFAAALANMLEAALTSFPNCLEAPAIDLPVAATEQKHTAAELTGPPLPTAQPGFVHKLIEVQARETPHAPALITAAETITYQELRWRVAQLAASLAARGARPGDNIGLVMDRRPDAIIAMLAVLQAGCAYAPIDPEFPPQRIADILHDLNAPLAVTVSEFEQRIAAAAPETPVLAMDKPDVAESTVVSETTRADDPAYILFTSGSTGAAKGVIVTHANLAFSTAARRAFYDAAPTSFLLLSAIIFDSSVAGIFWTLCSGGAVILPTAGAEKNAAEIGRLIASSKASHTLALPSLLDVLFEYAPADQLRSLTTIIAAGEALHGATAARLKAAAPQARVYNEYGPTEATVWCVACEVTDMDADAPAPIGGAIPGSRLSIRDRRGRPVPQGIPGELYVSGPGVAAGYLNRPDQTKLRFVNDPAAPEVRWYKTGDRVSLLKDGELEFLGRVDQQIKLRGRRIEPGEIENALIRQDGVANAVVKPFGEGSSMRLVAFIGQSDGVTPSDQDLRQRLAETLPDWMAPDQFVFMKELPVTRTGKIDRAALAEPDFAPECDDSLPETPLEESLVDIWRQALSLERAPGVNENFFDLGGNSLSAMRVFNEIEKTLGLTLPYSVLGKIATVAEQARQIEQSMGQSPEDAVSAAPSAPLDTDLFSGLADDDVEMLRSYMSRWPGEPAANGSMLRILNEHGKKPPLVWCFNNGDEFERLAGRLGADQPVIGMRSGNIILDLTPANQRRNNRRLAMTLLAEVLKAQPKGPFYLGGNCQGSAVAIELALALQAAGHPVSILFIMEAVPDHAFPGRVALLFGKDSDFHPYKNFQDPERAWRRRYLDFTVDFIPGRHGTYFRRLNVGGLAATVKRRLKEAADEAPRQLYGDDCRISWAAPEAPLNLAPGEQRRIAVNATNEGEATFHPSAESGLYVASRWLSNDGAIQKMKDGFADIPALWAPGAALAFELNVAAPAEPGRYVLEVDIVEEGVARFSERGGAPLKLNVVVGNGESLPSDPESVLNENKHKSTAKAAWSALKRFTGAS